MNVGFLESITLLTIVPTPTLKVVHLNELRSTPLRITLEDEEIDPSLGKYISRSFLRKIC